MIAQDIVDKRLYARRGANIRGSRIDAMLSILARVERDVISLAMGCPAPEGLPVEAMQEMWEVVLARYGADLFDYSATEGDDNLRAFLVERLRAEGVTLGIDNILITTGGMQGIDLVCKLFVHPDDPVIVESPSYSNGLAAINNYGGRILTVPADEEGLVIEAVEERVEECQRTGRPARLIYVIPTFQNPGGTTMPLKRREQLLEMARRHRLLILEDDPYRDLSFGEPAPPSLLSLDDSGTVLHVNTFAKTVSPGLRTGWVAAPKNVIAKMVLARHSMDTCTSTLSQKLTSEFCCSGRLEKHIETLIALYRARKERMIAALERDFGDGQARWTSPGGGFFIWFTLEEGLSSERLLEIALEEGVAFVPGSAFDFHQKTTHQMRLCFAYPTLKAIERGIHRLRKAVDRYRAEQG
jgi:2-aminoadipate transaminase